ncbi:hypothetical protein Acid345_3970 [Candidatus Koribacter versatilis Ellin345]|uniref:Uncharacterized protein n=1 Tax=Koribacter versatilis (strain Ellin345) TaxID=204669 RepID=Q1IJI0_KORVE|nr:hypothetical protein [Candidatus Koribacter versatilis]ABF42970.1 hypothetical protein Acid345_3970 [Candidatus Koribacter versatilis Ellin345]
MAELKRKDQELTTADLAGTNTTPESDRRPQLVRNDEAYPLQNETIRNEENIARDESFDAEDRKVATLNRGMASTAISPLFSDNEVGDFRNRWNNIQTGFVDEPRRAVEDADGLVAQLMKKLAEGFANERAGLEKQWDRGDNVSTEDLRVALQRYRSFFDRLLKI